MEKLLKTPPESKKPEKQPDKTWLYDSVSAQIRDVLGTKVNIVPGAKKSRIEIEYYSEEDLERLLELFQGLRK